MSMDMSSSKGLREQNELKELLKCASPMRRRQQQQQFPSPNAEEEAFAQSLLQSWAAEDDGEEAQPCNDHPLLGHLQSVKPSVGNVCNALLEQTSAVVASDNQESDDDVAGLGECKSPEPAWERMRTPSPEYDRAWGHDGPVNMPKPAHFQLPAQNLAVQASVQDNLLHQNLAPRGSHDMQGCQSFPYGPQGCNFEQSPMHGSYGSQGYNFEQSPMGVAHHTAPMHVGYESEMSYSHMHVAQYPPSLAEGWVQATHESSPMGMLQCSPCSPSHAWPFAGDRTPHTPISSSMPRAPQFPMMDGHSNGYDNPEAVRYGYPPSTVGPAGPNLAPNSSQPGVLSTTPARTVNLLSTHPTHAGDMNVQEGQPFIESQLPSSPQRRQQQQRPKRGQPSPTCSPSKPRSKLQGAVPALLQQNRGHNQMRSPAQPLTPGQQVMQSPFEQDVHTQKLTNQQLMPWQQQPQQAQQPLQPQQLFQAHPAVLSIGSRGHPENCGKTCRFIHKAVGCKQGEDCLHCHLCPKQQGKKR